ncbi:hypothetical protein MTYM_00286 [Methylococcales bacterium]|nr:hypothetical protein MTYM_00286 [Methylococcales bacterium]
MGLDGTKIRHIRNHQVTVCGLDTGIHAGITTFSGLSAFVYNGERSAWEHIRRRSASSLFCVCG